MWREANGEGLKDALDASCSGLECAGRKVCAPCLQISEDSQSRQLVSVGRSPPSRERPADRRDDGRFVAAYTHEGRGNGRSR